PGGWLQAWRLEGEAFKAGPSWEGPLDVSAVAVASDGKTLAAGGLPCASEGGEGPRLRLRKPRAKTPPPSPGEGGGPFSVRALAFSPDGKTLASVTGETVRLWDIEGWRPPRWLAWTLTVLLGLAGVGVLIRRRLGSWLAVAGVIASLVVGAVGVLGGGPR